MSAPTKSRPSLSLPKLPKRESNAVPRSQVERLWFVGGGLVAFVMLLVGYFFFISPQRSDTASVNGQASTVQQQNVALQARLDALRQQSKNLPRYQAELAQLKLALPSESGISDFVRTLQSLGNATLTDVQSLTVGAPAPVIAPAAAAPTETSDPTATAATPTSDTTVPQTIAPSAYSLTITANVTGTASALSKFLDQLQSVQPRAVLVSNVNLTGGTSSGGTGGNGAYTLTVTMKAFVAPASVTDATAPSTSAGP